MSPRFAPDLEAANATTPIYEKGDYQVKIVRCRPSVFLNKNDEMRASINYDLKMVGQYNSKGKLDTKEEGKDVRPQTLWLHTEKTEGMNKQFLMAAMGYSRTPEDEEAANKAFFSKHEFWIDGEPGDENFECGNGYHEPVGRIVNVSLDVEIYEGAKQQKHGYWSPAES